VFDQQTFGQDRLVTHSLGEYLAGTTRSNGKHSWRKPAHSIATRYRPRFNRIGRLLSGLTSEQKKDKLSRISYKNYLLNVAKIHPKMILYQPGRMGYGVGIDAVWCLDCWALQQPGFKGLRLDLAPSANGYTPMGFASQRPYEFHYRTATPPSRECWFAG
jgi:spermidine dehydrogenase